MKTILAIFTIIASAALSPARLGEDKATCEKRYGEPLDTSGGVNTSKKAGYGIQTMFNERGKCVLVGFMTLETGMSLEQAELLAARSIGRKIDLKFQREGIWIWTSGATLGENVNDKLVVYYEKQNFVVVALTGAIEEYMKKRARESIDDDF